MSFKFSQLKVDQHLFFEMLPEDWQKVIMPYWNAYKNSADIYVITENDIIIGGGILFSTCPPDLLYMEKKAQQWLDKGYLYIGFLWIAENRRNSNLGSFWLDSLKELKPYQKYWLLIEEEHLHHFYLKNKFRLLETIKNDDQQEWLYVYDP